MPTDTPAAAASPLARDMAIALLCPRPERALSLNDLSEDIAFANEQRVWDMKFAATTALLDAKLAPVRQALRLRTLAGHNHACIIHQRSTEGCICGHDKLVEALASLSPQPPEAQR